MQAEIHYDHDGCHVRLVDENGKEVGRRYEYRGQHDSWEACKQAALRQATEKLGRWEAPPAAETIEL